MAGTPLRPEVRGKRAVQLRIRVVTLRDAKLQLKPLQKNMEFAVASIVSPSGMTLAGKHETGVLSVGSLSRDGIRALPLQ